MIDLSTYDDDGLDALRVVVLTEQGRRAVVAHAPAEAEALAQRWSEASGRADGDEWTQPQGAHDAYPAGSTVTHGGKTWESLTPANVWEPGTSGWREVVAGNPDGEPGVADWVAPTGGHDAYSVGDRVRFEGQVWESTIAGNVWSPSAYPQGWKLITV